jgi:hypothetical protein
LRVCLPSKKELLPFFDQNANRAEQLWEFFVSSRARGGVSSTAYIYCIFSNEPPGVYVFNYSIALRSNLGLADFKGELENKNLLENIRYIKLVSP